MPLPTRPELRSPRPPELLAVVAPLWGLWGVMLLLVRPDGEFPLNDDWIYGRAVLQWMESGHYTGHPFSTATLVAQAAWGRLFCSVWGFSFEALRWSTLFLWVIGATVTSLMAHRVGAGRWPSALAGCLVIANPLAMNLGYTFMTDVPFLTITALAAYAYLRALEEFRVSWILAGSVAGALGLLTRQFAVVILVAFLIAMAPSWRGLWRRNNGWRVAALLAPWIVAGLVLLRLPNNAADLGHVWMPTYLGDTVVRQWYGAAKFYGVALVYLALFALPLLAVAACHWYRIGEAFRPRRVLWTVPALVTVALSATAIPPHRMPYLDNILYDLGIGPMTLAGSVTDAGPWTPVSLNSAWWLPTLVGLLGGAWMLVATGGWLRDRVVMDSEDRASRRQFRQRVFLGAWVILTLLALYHPWLPVRFDRYLLGALVPVLVLLAPLAGSLRGSWRGVQAAVLLAIFGFSLAAQHDYLAWNRVRWEGLHDLMDQGIRPEAIDGGYEFNGWYTSPHFIEEDGAVAFRRSGAKGWWVVDDAYAIGWRPLPGDVVLRELPYDSWLGRDQRLLVLQRPPTH